MSDGSDSRVFADEVEDPNGEDRRAVPVLLASADIAKVSDPVTHPAHYTFGKIEVWDAIADWKLSYCLGNVVKYVVRAAHKGKQIEDLKKAQAYLAKAIELLEMETI